MNSLTRIAIWRLLIIGLIIVSGAIASVFQPPQQHRAWATTRGTSAMNHRGRSGRRSSGHYDSFQALYSRSVSASPGPIGLGDYVTSEALAVDEDRVRRLIREYKQLVVTTPEEDGAWNNLAWLQATSGDPLSALQCEIKAIALRPDDYSYHVVLGAIYEHIGRLELARQSYAEALVSFPRLSDSAFWSSLHQRQPAIAEDAMHQALSRIQQADPKSTNGGHKEVLARLLLASGESSRAIALAKVNEEQMPNLSGVWELQGELDELTDSILSAGVDYRRAVFLNPFDPFPYERLSQISEREGNVQSARSKLLQAWSLSRRLRSPSAEQRLILYQRSDGSPQGTLPTSLLEETQPDIDFPTAFLRLANALKAAGELNGSAEMEKMATLARRRVHGKKVNNYK